MIFMVIIKNSRKKNTEKFRFLFFKHHFFIYLFLFFGGRDMQIRQTLITKHLRALTVRQKIPVDNYRFLQLILSPRFNKIGVKILRKQFNQKIKEKHVKELQGQKYRKKRQAKKKKEGKTSERMAGNRKLKSEKRKK